MNGKRRIVVAIMFLAAGQALGRSYYATIFGAQQGENVARSSHTWATFVAVDGDQIVDEQTISWLPAPGHFGPDNTMPLGTAVPGQNYSLDDALDLMRDHQIMFWGPFAIQPELWSRAVERIEFLGLGETDYKMVILDQALREPALYNQPGGAINCIMAVSDLGGYLDTGQDWGFAASRKVLGWLSRWIDDYPSGVHDDVGSLMGIESGNCRGVSSCIPGGS